MSKLNHRNMMPEFQARVKTAETCEDMLAASFAFIQFHGGFSGCPEARGKFIERMSKEALEEAS